MMENLRGWNYLVYTIIKNNFYETFELKDIYAFKKYFVEFYPKNNFVEEKIRQTLQNLTKKEIIKSNGFGKYHIAKIEKIEKDQETKNEIVYALSNTSIPNWIKIGRTNNIEERLKSLYNTSVPTKFNLENSIKTEPKKSFELEKCIHAIIDTLDPGARKDTEAYKREFFKLSIEQVNAIFETVTKISNIKVQK